MIHLCREAFSGVEIYVERYAALSYNGGGFKDPGFEARVCESQFRAVVRITERGGEGPDRRARRIALQYLSPASREKSMPMRIFSALTAAAFFLYRTRDLRRALSATGIRAPAYERT